MFAFVKFTSSQKERWIVLCTEIKNFKPKTDRDFSPDEVYRVKWQKSDLLDDGCYECHIICLGDSFDDLKENAAKLSAALPRRKSLAATEAISGSTLPKEPTSSSKSSDSNKKRLKKMSEKATLNARRRAAQEILNAVKSTPISIKDGGENASTKGNSPVKKLGTVDEEDVDLKMMPHKIQESSVVKQGGNSNAGCSNISPNTSKNSSVDNCYEAGSSLNKQDNTSKEKDTKSQRKKRQAGSSVKSQEDNVQEERHKSPKKKTVISSGDGYQARSSSKGRDCYGHQEKQKSPKKKKNSSSGDFNQAGSSSERRQENAIEERPTKSPRKKKNTVSDGFTEAQETSSFKEEGDVMQERNNKSPKKKTASFSEDFLKTGGSSKRQEYNVNQEREKKSPNKKVNFSDNCNLAGSSRKRQGNINEKTLTKSPKKMKITSSDIWNPAVSTPKKQGDNVDLRQHLSPEKGQTSLDDTLPATSDDEQRPSTNFHEEFTPKRTSSFYVIDSDDDKEADDDFEDSGSEASFSGFVRDLEEKHKKEVADLNHKLDVNQKQILTLRAAVKIGDNTIKDLKMELDTLKKNSVQNKEVVHLVHSVKGLIEVINSSKSSALQTERNSSVRATATARRISFDDSQHLLSPCSASSPLSASSHAVSSPPPFSSQHVQRSNQSPQLPTTSRDCDGDLQESNLYITEVSNAVLEDMRGTKRLPLDSTGVNVIFPGGLKVNSQIWKTNLKPAKRESLLVRKMSTQLWGYDGLKNRSVKGGKNSRSGVRKPQATPKKVQLIAGCVRAFDCHRQTLQNKQPVQMLSPEAALAVAETHVGRAMVDEIAKRKKEQTATKDTKSIRGEADSDS